MGDAERADRAAQQGGDRLARKLRGINETAKQSRSQGMLLPILDADPEPDDPTNYWGFDDGRLRFRGSDGTVHTIWSGFRLLTLDADPDSSTGIDMYRHRTSSELRVRRPNDTWERYAPIAASDGGGKGDPGGSTTKPKASDPRTKKYRKDYAPTWSRSLCPRHGVETGGSLYYGRFSATHEERRVMLGFDDAGIRADLSGAVIRAVYVKMRNAHAYYNGGVDVHFGGHNKSAAPASYSSVRESVFDAHWPKVGYGAEWRQAPKWFGEALRDNTIKGLTINQPSGSVAFYGAMDPGTFRLRVVYSK